MINTITDYIYYIVTVTIAIDVMRIFLTNDRHHIIISYLHNANFFNK